jgi:hypothetical protein
MEWWNNGKAFKNCTESGIMEWGGNWRLFRMGKIGIMGRDRNCTEWGIMDWWNGGILEKAIRNTTGWGMME